MMPKTILFSLIILWTSPCVNGQGGQESRMLAGAATINITPQLPVPMSGYADRDEPSKGVHDEIFARALVFDDGKNKACIVQADLIGFSFEFTDEINREIEKRAGIPKQNSLVVAAHNRGAPATGVYGEAVTENHKAYITELKKKLIDVAVEAFKKRAPVLIGFGKGNCTMNINRRAKHPEGGIWLGRNPDGPCDHEVDVLRLDNTNSEAIGLLVNWPCHATVGGQETN
jgi:neutral ceramidase